jgi:hypothetical protein
MNTLGESLWVVRIVVIRLAVNQQTEVRFLDNPRFVDEWRNKPINSIGIGKTHTA